MVRKLKFHEKKLLKKVDFISWDLDKNVHEATVIRKFHLKKREEYTLYNKLSRSVRTVGEALKELNGRDPFRVALAGHLLTKLYEMGLIATKRSLEECMKVSASSFCRRRLAVVMVRSKMAPTVKLASQLVEQGHVRVGPELVLDPAFLVPRTLEDFINWTNSSAIRRHILDYNDERDDFELMD